MEQPLPGEPLVDVHGGVVEVLAVVAEDDEIRVGLERLPDGADQPVGQAVAGEQGRLVTGGGLGPEIRMPGVEPAFEHVMGPVGEMDLDHEQVPRLAGEQGDGGALQPLGVQPEDLELGREIDAAPEQHERIGLLLDGTDRSQIAVPDLRRLRVAAPLVHHGVVETQVAGRFRALQDLDPEREIRLPPPAGGAHAERRAPFAGGELDEHAVPARRRGDRDPERAVRGAMDRDVEGERRPTPERFDHPTAPPEPGRARPVLALPDLVRRAQLAAGERGEIVRRRRGAELVQAFQARPAGRAVEAEAGGGGRIGDGELDHVGAAARPRRRSPERLGMTAVGVAAQTAVETVAGPMDQVGIDPGDIG